MQIPDYIKNRYWKDYLPPGISLEIDIPENLTLRDVFEKGAELYGDKVALNYYNNEFTLHSSTNLQKDSQTHY